MRNALTKPFKALDGSIDNSTGTVYLVKFFRISRFYKNHTEQDELKREAVKLLYRSYTDFTDVNEGKMHTERPSTVKGIFRLRKSLGIPTDDSDKWALQQRKALPRLSSPSMASGNSNPRKSRVSSGPKSKRCWRQELLGFGWPGINTG